MQLQIMLSFAQIPMQTILVKYFFNFLFLQISFMLMLMKEYVLFLRISNFYLQLKKLRQPFILPVIYLYFTYLNTCWAKPNDLGPFHCLITIEESSFYV